MLNWLTVLITSSILLTIIILISNSWNPNNAEAFNFECGFTHKQTTSIPFSTNFFSIGVLFLIFDLEVSLFLPIFFPENLEISPILTSNILIIILTVGLLIEWSGGAINWAN